MFKKLILTATFFEAAPILNLFPWQKIRRNYFESHEYSLLITGIGPTNVQKNFSALTGFKIKAAFNIGICAGVLHLEPGEIVIPEQILTEDELQNYNIKITQTLLSLKQPMQKPAEILALNPVFLQLPYMAVDMEAGFLKPFFNAQNIPFYTYKVVSDSGTEDFLLNFNERKKTLQSTLEYVAKKHLFNVAI